MRELTDPEIRAAFLNCSKGEAKRLNLPRELPEQPWPELDFLGWRDPQAPDRAYLVAELDGRPQAVVLRSSSGASWQPRRSICSLCVTTHTGGVSLLVAPLAGPAGRQGNSVGAYMCSDLACPLYVRGLRETGTKIHESLTQEQRIERMRGNLAAFLAKVRGEAAPTG
ncbi:FBP domain-containing protein [Kitasatospora cineracea]|uniref:FBP domain-containing protein n=1 Tax=Kitasatospora TaxID=2063 RepID=UPI0004C42809|nr:MULTISPECIES: FBP domain-containing protein [unclassified Kitasatospora]WAL76074.1 FBP domain-containing protein [Kitasatospora sp. YST-16]WNW42127.1 FBP domain-containing protein [Streptomyces sp. Li-HN-5-13]